MFTVYNMYTIYEALLQSLKTGWVFRPTRCVIIKDGTFNENNGKEFKINNIKSKLCGCIMIKPLDISLIKGHCVMYSCSKFDCSYAGDKIEIYYE